MFSLSSLKVILKGFFKRSAVWGVPAVVPMRFLMWAGVLVGSSGGVIIILGKQMAPKSYSNTNILQSRRRSSSSSSIGLLS